MLKKKVKCCHFRRSLGTNPINKCKQTLKSPSAWLKGSHLGITAYAYIFKLILKLNNIFLKGY